MSDQTGGMAPKGDIPARGDVRPPGILSEEACAKVAVVDSVINSGGSAHVYLKSVDGDDEHLYEYNTHRFPVSGWVFFHGDDLDKWIPGDDIGMVERHYQ